MVLTPAKICRTVRPGRAAENRLSPHQISLWTRHGRGRTRSPLTTRRAGRWMFMRSSPCPSSWGPPRTWCCCRRDRRRCMLPMRSCRSHREAETAACPISTTHLSNRKVTNLNFAAKSRRRDAGGETLRFQIPVFYFVGNRKTKARTIGVRGIGEVPVFSFHQGK